MANQVNCTAIDKILDRLYNEVSNLVSGTDWETIAKACSILNNFSPRNALLISMQARTRETQVTTLAGYNNWRKLGRQVTSGEQGYGILAPVFAPNRPKHTDAGIEPPTTQSNSAQRPPVVGFRWVTVFDVSQTTGRSLEAPIPKLLAGGCARHEQIVERMESIARNYGFSVSYEAMELANGMTDFSTKKITLRSDLQATQRGKTLAHELGHVLLHSKGIETRAIAEIEAETTAYLVMAALSIEAAQYSFPYIASWSKGDLSAVMSVGERALTAARKILSAFEDTDKDFPIAFDDLISAR